MNEFAKNVFTKSDNYFSNMVLLLEQMDPNEMDLAEGIDHIYALSEASKKIDTIRKTLDKLNEQLQDYVSMVLFARHKKSYSTEFATGTRRSAQNPRIPTMKSDPENYIKLMRYFGIPDDAIKNEILRPHWPSLREYLSYCMSQGLPIPDGLDVAKLEPRNTISIRSKKEIA